MANMGIRLCSCGNTIKRMRYDPKYCSEWCGHYFRDGGSSWNLRGQKVSLTCLWCNSDFELTYGKRFEKVFCNTECSQTAQQKHNWFNFNVCRILKRHPEGLTAEEIARLMDEFDFHQNSHRVSSRVRRLVSSGVLIREKQGVSPTTYRLSNPEGFGQEWLSDV